MPLINLPLALIHRQVYFFPHVEPAFQNIHIPKLLLFFQNTTNG